MYVAVDTDAVAAIRAEVRRSDAHGSLVRRFWQRVEAARRSRADREIADALCALGHVGVIEDFQRARGRR